MDSSQPCFVVSCSFVAWVNLEVCDGLLLNNARRRCASELVALHRADAFFLYKALISAYFLFWCVRWPFQYTDIFLFVTYWAWYMGALYFLLSTVTALVNLERGPLRNPVTEDASQPWQDQEEGVLTLSEAQEKVSTCEQFLFAAQRVSGNISGVSSLVVATVFWSSLYVGGPISSVDINAHSFFACIMLIDQFIVATPRRLRDIWISMLFASIYLVFDFIWYIAAPSGDKVIYIILDWKRNLDEALLYSFGTVLVLIPIFTLVHFGIFRFREFLYAMCQKRVQSTPTVLSSALLEPEGSANRAATRANIGRSRSYVDV